MYKAIFSDIDGTLFRDDLTISPGTKEAIRKAHEKGIRIILCSGRYIPGIERAREQLDIPVIFAAINGALIKDGNYYLREERIDREVYREAAAYLKGKVSSLIAFCENRYAIDANDEWYELQERICRDKGVRMDITSAEHVFEETGEYPYKILVKDNDRNKIESLLTELQGILGDKAFVVSSSPNNFEVLPPGIDKRDAIQIVSSYLGINIMDTVAFGDWDNDAGMIKASGLGIAMKNGSENAKKAADFITRSNEEDGIPHALKEFGII